MRLYAITGSAYLKNGVTLVEAVRAALRGGADVVQLREKELSGKRLVELGCELQKICQEAGALFVVNDRVDVAMLCDADAVHVGQDDIGLTDVRKLSGDTLAVGVSTHSIGEALEAQLAGATYVGLGPFAQTNTKRDAKPIVPVEHLQIIRAGIKIPIVAIGGIQVNHVRNLILSGADAVAVVSGLFAADDIEAASRAYRREVDMAWSQREYMGDRGGVL